MYFPLLIIDNFLDNFNDVKNYALQQDFKPKKLHLTMPGKATTNLRELNFNYYKLFCEKILNIFYNRHSLNNINYDCVSYFEKILPYGENIDKEGWIHSDDTNILSCIFYIQVNKEHGTSFFKKKTIGKIDTSLFYIKESLYNNQNIDNFFYNENLKKHNAQFELTLKVPLIENRLVLFDSSILHRSDGYGEKEYPRIIQTCFFRTITGPINFPIPELKRNN